MKRDSKGRFKPGVSGNVNGRPTDPVKKVNNILNSDEIVYDGNDLEYIGKHITALSKAGQHDKALELVIDTLQYRTPKISSVDGASGDDKELVIKFADADPIPKDHPLNTLLKKE